MKKREIFGWAFFDFANSSYVTIVITAIYSSFFVKYVIPEDYASPNSLWSAIITAGTIIAMLLSPIAGAICDLAGKKKGYLIAATLTCAASTIGLAWVDTPTFWLGIGLITISYVAFMLSETFCASFLTDIATPKTMGLISGLGWGIGYFGGLVSLLIVKAVAGGTEGSRAEIVANHQNAMVATGLFFALAALPTFILVKERSKPQPGFENAGFATLASAGLARLLKTMRMVSQHKRLFRFFIAFLFYSAGVGAAITFSGILARTELEMTTADLITFFAIIQVLAAFGAILFGFVESKRGSKQTLIITLILWTIGSLVIFQLDTISGLLGITPKSLFFIDSAIIGLGLGSVQACSRTVVGLLTPKNQSAEMFGFWGFASRLSTLLGMLLGPLADYLNSLQAAVGLVALFFVIGIVLLLPQDLRPEPNPT